MIIRFWKMIQWSAKLSPGLFIPLLIFMLFFCFILVWSLSPVVAEGYIPAPLHASTQANYALVDDNQIPRIDHDIIQDIILDQSPFGVAEVGQRMATLQAELLTPVPEKTSTSLAPPTDTSTPSPVPSASPSPSVSPEPSPTLTDTPSSSSSSFLLL